MNLPSIVSEHLKFIVFPFGYSVVHPFDGLVWTHQPWMIVSWAIVLLLAGVIWLTILRRTFSFFGMGWLGIGLLLWVAVKVKQTWAGDDAKNHG